MFNKFVSDQLNKLITMCVSKLAFCQNIVIRVSKKQFSLRSFKLKDL